MKKRPKLLLAITLYFILGILAGLYADILIINKIDFFGKHIDEYFTKNYSLLLVGIISALIINILLVISLIKMKKISIVFSGVVILLNALMVVNHIFESGINVVFKNEMLVSKIIGWIVMFLIFIYLVVLKKREILE
jgi:hypothetical protein